MKTNIKHILLIFILTVFMATSGIVQSQPLLNNPNNIATVLATTDNEDSEEEVEEEEVEEQGLEVESEDESEVEDTESFATVPGEGDTTTDPGEGDTTTDPGEGDTTTDPGEGDTTTDPGEGDTTTDPGEGDTTTDPGEGDTTTDPGEGDTTTDPGEGDTTTDPGEGDTTTDPGEGDTTTDPGEGDTTGECPSGTVRDDESDACIPEETDDTPCEEGEIKNEAGVCVPEEIVEPTDEECPSGTVRDDESDACIPEETDDTPCEEGEIKNEAGVCVPEEIVEPTDEEQCTSQGGTWKDGKCTPNNEQIICSGDQIPTDDGKDCRDNPLLHNCKSDEHWDGKTCQPRPHCLDNEEWSHKDNKCHPDGKNYCGFGEKCCHVDGKYYPQGHYKCRHDYCKPPYHWDAKDKRCEVEYKTKRTVDTNVRSSSNIDNCPKSFIVAVDSLRLPGCLVSSANGIGTIHFLERNFNNIIISNNKLPNVLLSFTPDELRTTSSGQNVMTQLIQIASKDGVNSRGVDQIQFAFKVDWNPQPDTSSNTFTYCKGDGCETHRYNTTF